MQKRTFNLLLSALVISGVMMIGFAGKIWYTTIYLDEERTFWATIDNSLSIGSYSKAASSNNPSQAIIQTQKVNFMGEVAVRNNISLNAEGQGPDEIEVETYGYSDADYFRYVKLDLADADQNARGEDAVNVWATNVDPEDSDVQLLVEALASSFVLHGYFDKDTRSELVERLRDGVYEIDFENVAKTDQDGRPIYVYRATIDVSKFSMAFAQYMRELGNEELAADIESATYTTSAQADISVDARSRRLISVVNVTSADAGEVFTGQGVPADFSRPENPIKFDELQTRLDE